MQAVVLNRVPRVYNNGGGGEFFSKVKRLVRKCVGTWKRLSCFLPLMNSKKEKEKETKE